MPAYNTHTRTHTPSPRTPSTRTPSTHKNHKRARTTQHNTTRKEMDVDLLVVKNSTILISKMKKKVQKNAGTKTTVPRKGKKDPLLGTLCCVVLYCVCVVFCCVDGLFRRNGKHLGSNSESEASSRNLIKRVWGSVSKSRGHNTSAA